MLPDGTMVSLDDDSVSTTCATCNDGGSHHRPPCDHDCRPVPAPMTAILVGLGLGGVVGWRRLKGRK
ncbi:MAG: PEP-CTERM sorting domain-containing protein [Thermodesulfobacteria bacterium]|nr:PEP-CTERM sorting domain-containing protein [Thermodesulfobacteriota bacterium]